ncbi:MAG TPA: hypothetical protein P5050_00620 [Bacteroidia bacterium]|nr:hypothetical protein [Bacteroidia bacterium]HRS57704.1 hypothetical protein [Bacteroidia bacterium]HRU67081.1 hypothetical protein [Bacteroidia bacterium]
MVINPDHIIKKQNDSGDRPGWIVLLVCVVIAFFIWIIQSLDENYKVTVQIKLNYINYPEDKVLSKPLPNEIVLQIKAKGWDLIKLQNWRKDHSLTINLKNHQKNIVLSEYNLRYFLPEGVEKISIISVSPTVIYLDYDNFFSKKVSVVPDIKISYRKHYYPVDSLHVNPRFVEIKGPEKEVREITSISTHFKQYTDVYQDISDSILLKKPENPLIKLNTEKVVVSQKIEQLTEGTFRLDINMPPSALKKYLIIPDKISVTFQATLSSFNQVNPSHFHAFTNPENKKLIQGNKVKVIVDYDKTLIKNIRFSPEYVNFVVKKVQ